METNVKIFIVDDDAFYRSLMEQMLSSNGLNEIHTFDNGIDCLNHLHLNPDIIFLDYCMDTYDGYETLRKIKRYNPNIFVVMVSAQDDIQTAVNTLKSGAFDYLQKKDTKPERLQTILQNMGKVKELLKQRKPSFVRSILRFF